MKFSKKHMVLKTLGFQKNTMKIKTKIFKTTLLLSDSFKNVVLISNQGHFMIDLSPLKTVIKNI
jgi:hypothetical protein